MQYIDSKYFSFLQNWIVGEKIKGASYEKISLMYQNDIDDSEHLSHEAIKTCLKRSSLSLRWEKGQTFGQIPVLSEVDIDLLKIEISDNVNNDFIDTETVIELVEKLRNERFINAQRFLNEIRCYSILNEIVDLSKIYQTGNTWVYQHIKSLEAELCTAQNVEINRIIACCPEKIEKFVEKFVPIVEQYHPSLIFASDETMLQPGSKKKVIKTKKKKAKAVIPSNIEMPHITANCLCNVVGDKMPLFIILPNLVKLPTELQTFSENGKAIFSSSSDGWETRDTFLYFIICFINWLSIFRLTLNPSIRNQKALLIVDGHKSRECPIAIKMLKDHNISLFVLPAHTSHITQIFDVGIGSPMKRYFTKTFLKLMENFRADSNQSAQLRKFCVKAAILAWDVKCNMVTCSNAAAATCTYPCSAKKLLDNKFVFELNPRLQRLAEEKEKRKKKQFVNINCELITEDKMLDLINTMIKESKFHSHLSLENYSGNYINSIKDILTRTINKCYYLSPILSYMDNDNQLHNFQ